LAILVTLRSARGLGTPSVDSPTLTSTFATLTTKGLIAIAIMLARAVEIINARLEGAHAQRDKLVFNRCLHCVRLFLREHLAA
jgi:hypothetical protein